MDAVRLQDFLAGQATPEELAQMVDLLAQNDYEAIADLIAKIIDNNRK